MKTACICAIGSAAGQRRVFVIRCAAWFQRHGGVRNGKIRKSCSTSVGEQRCQANHVLTNTRTFCLISYDDMISDNKHGGFSEPEESERFPGLTHFSEAHWHYTIDTWQDQIIRSPSATVSPRSRESSVWFKWFRRGIPFRKRFPNEQAAISIADPLPGKEKKNGWKKERGIEQLSARFAFRSVVLVVPRW